MEELARLGYIDYRACRELNVTNSDLNWADVVLLGRLDSWYEYQLVKKLKKAGKYLVYVIDDDLLNVPLELSSAEYYAQPEIKHNIRRMIELSDAILSPSPLLLRKYVNGKRAGLLVEEPAIDPIPYERHDPAMPIKIGFAGSVDRTGDLEDILSNVLGRIKREYGDRVQFEFFGAIPAFAEDLDAVVIPYCDSYDAYRKTLNDRKWDIGLAPMPDTPFHACKHYNKFIEYAAAGCLTIHSELEPYLRLKAFQSSMFSLNDKACWYAQLRKVIDDDAYREELRRRACEVAHNRLNCSVIAQELFESAKQCIPCIERVGCVSVCLPVMKGIGYIVHMRIRLRLIRKRGPHYIWKKVCQKVFG